MSVSPPQSPSESLSNVDYLNTNEQTCKDDDIRMNEEGDPDESLHIGADLLADRLDYEAEEELDEQEEISIVSKSSPVNHKDSLSQEFDPYDLDGKQHIRNSFDDRLTTDEVNISGACEVQTEDKVAIVESGISKNNETDNNYQDVRSNINLATGEDTATEVSLETKNNAGNSSEQNEGGTVEEGIVEVVRQSSQNISNEELEEGEVSDEDEEARKERLKPQPVCRFYSKGACTWGSSCRFIHPGVMDTGR